MKLLLLLNLDSKNIGDDYIASQIERSFKLANKNNVINTSAFVFFRGYKLKLYGLIIGFAKLIKNMVIADKIVIAGGNLIMPASKVFLLCFLVIITFSRLLNKEIEIHFVGVSGINHKFRSNLLKYLLKDIHITVRDKTSQRILKNKLGINSKITADAAFLHSCKPIKIKSLKKMIFIPISYEAYSYEKDGNSYPCNKRDFYNMYNKYISSIKDTMDIEILITDKTDQEIAKLLVAKYDLGYIQVGDERELVNYLTNYDGFIVSTRMHGGIVSLISGIPVVFLDWHHKLRSLSREFAGKLPVIDFGELNIGRVIEQIEIAEWEEVNILMKTKHDLLNHVISEIAQ